MKKSKKGIGPIVGSLVASLASGLLSRKRDRDSETTGTGGVLRDVGITAAAASSGSMALAANGIISCATYGLEQEFCNAAHGLLLIAGFVMYWIGISKVPKQADTDQKHEK